MTYTALDYHNMLPEDSVLRAFLPTPAHGDRNPDLVVIIDGPNAMKGNPIPLTGRNQVSIRRAILHHGFSYCVVPRIPFHVPGEKYNLTMAQDTESIFKAELNSINCNKYLVLGSFAANNLLDFSYQFSRHDELLGRNFYINDKVYRFSPAVNSIVLNHAKYTKFQDDIAELVLGKRLRSSEDDEVGYIVSTSKTQMIPWFNRMRDAEFVSIDLETTGLDWLSDEILTVSLSWGSKAITVPWTMFTPQEWAEWLSGKKFIAQNGQFDLKFLYKYGVLLNLYADTSLMHSLIDENPGTHNMEYMAKRYLTIDKWVDKVDYNEFKHGLVGMRNPPNIDITNPPSQEFSTVGDYAARDVDITMRLYNEFKPKVEGLRINTVLHSVQNALIRSETTGIKIDREAALSMQREIHTLLADKQEYMEDVYGLRNANSPKQVAMFLYGELGVPPQKFKGSITTKNELIEPYADEYPAIKDILEYRRLTKTNGMYLTNILDLSEHDGRYHPNIKLAATVTGRVTDELITLLPRSDEIENPDLGQQYQAKLRSLFIADEGHKMIGADYSQLEVRVAAMLSRDPQLIADVNNNIDIHGVNAVQAFNLPVDLEPANTLKARVSKEYAHYRTMAKIATFGSLYGGTAATIALQSKMGLDEAQAIIDQLYSRYYILKAWQDATILEARSSGYVQTPWGRTRRFNYGTGLSEYVETKQDREAINSPIQSHGNDINLDAYAKITFAGVHTLFPFHDACYAQSPEDRVEEDMATMKEIMESIVDNGVTIGVDIKSGNNWMEL